MVDENNEPIRCDRITDSELLRVLNKTLNRTEIYTGDYDDFLYFEGDYSDSHLKAQSMENTKTL